MKIVRFNGSGQSVDGTAKTGDILLIIRGAEIGVARLTLLPPGQFGPELDDAINMAELVDDARHAYLKAYPGGLSDEQHWTLECPPELAARARFLDA